MKFLSITKCINNININIVRRYVLPAIIYNNVKIIIRLNKAIKFFLVNIQFDLYIYKLFYDKGLNHE